MGCFSPPECFFFSFELLCKDRRWSAVSCQTCFAAVVFAWPLCFQLVVWLVGWLVSVCVCACMCVCVCVCLCLRFECVFTTVTSHHRVSRLRVWVWSRGLFTSPPAVLEELLSSWLRAEGDGETFITTRVNAPIQQNACFQAARIGFV